MLRILFSCAQCFENCPNTDASARSICTTAPTQWLHCGIATLICDGIFRRVTVKLAAKGGTESLYPLGIPATLCLAQHHLHLGQCCLVSGPLGKQGVVEAFSHHSSFNPGQSFCRSLFNSGLVLKGTEHIYLQKNLHCKRHLFVQTYSPAFPKYPPQVALPKSLFKSLGGGSIT